ncbi:MULTISPECIES: thiol peroxidase [unclassified Gilliamella]|uniref:thiol peroxidase n=1 Tax=unclassified Gilliamella TaxID=2685620 RepID=UPI00226AED6D|nr:MULTISPECIES: thiol peroxidase [unclassified Gilliamella]MCX8600486.1 thiol peroxidase [Gilliamella sp. B3722]MCX8608802.1 thiol peroxidase [Gilliamella sp. B3771]MCX8609702.1 thiol peroxidase [Gilliamella sp. B3891]MCX8612208.1 thiol peroxidase [Gilliamella sp. B3773]MCX8616602.1 thiol peroxidase [Gilliamella sp. B3770]
MQKITNQVTMRGVPVTLLGTHIKVGDKAPDFTVQDSAMKPVKLSDFKGKVRIINSVPSIDTSVCSAQVHRFNTQAAKLKDVVIFSVSVDLPFALNRYCAAEGIDAVKVTSDHKDLDFGLKYGVVIEQLRLLTRAVFVVDKNDNIVYVQYVKETSEEPDYDKVLAVINTLK